MSMRNLLLVCGASLALSLPLGIVLAASDAKIMAPTQVQKALGTLNRVVDHTQRLIAAKNYAQLPHENGEFKEGSEALEKAIAAEPAGFKEKVEPLLKKANMASDDIAAAAGAHNDAKLSATHAVLVSSVKDVLAAFPANVQPAPPSVADEKAEERARN